MPAKKNFTTKLSRKERILKDARWHDKGADWRGSAKAGHNTRVGVRGEGVSFSRELKRVSAPKSYSVYGQARIG